MRSEPELLAAVKRGDRAAAEELIALHEPQIYRFGLRMCGDEETAREVLQETLLAAFKSLGGFRGEAALSTWLYQIARSFCIKERRREHPEDPIEEARGIAGAEPGPEATTHAREIGAALGAAIRALSPEQREVVILRDVEGLSAEEAAGVIGIEVGALKSRLHRARLDLRAHLADLLGDDVEAGGPAPCPELAHELSAYASSEIDEAACVKIEEHLARCPRCAGACEVLRRTVSLCRALPGDEVPAPVRAAVRRAVHALLHGDREGDRGELRAGDERGRRPPRVLGSVVRPVPDVRAHLR
jgi:RNA polymerase sigma-70 factor, ECF subfamily